MLTCLRYIDGVPSDGLVYARKGGRFMLCIGAVKVAVKTGDINVPIDRLIVPMDSCLWFI